MTANNDYYVTVCSSCLTASCWHGEFMCERSQSAGTTTMRASELDSMKREHPTNYSRSKILAVTGSEPEEVSR